MGIPPTLLVQYGSLSSGVLGPMSGENVLHLRETILLCNVVMEMADTALTPLEYASKTFAGGGLRSRSPRKYQFTL